MFDTVDGEFSKFFKMDQKYFTERNWSYHLKGHSQNNVLVQRMTSYMEIPK